MSILDSSENDALAFLKSKRSEDSTGAPIESEEETTQVEDDEGGANSYLEDEAEQEEATDTYDEEEESLYFDIDGEQITLDQIREWKRGNLRESDYTQKTQALSAERKEIESIKQKHVEKLNKLDTKIEELESLLQTEENAVDWDDLIETDPSQYLKLQKQQAKRREKLKEAQESKLAEQNRMREEYLNKQMVMMRDLVPEWQDDSGFTEEANKDIPIIQSYLQTKSFSPDDINQVVDARLWAVFRDAARYNAIKGKKPTVDRQLKKAPKVIKPAKGGRKAVQRSHVDDAAKQFKKTGSEQDALAYLKARRT